MWTGMLRTAVLGLGLTGALMSNALAESVLRVAMTAGDVPITIGQPDQGFEGYRFVGYSLYDSLIGWDLASADRASGIVPGLATEWHVDPADNTRWIVKLREGVRWHDGAPFTADDVVWNFEKLLNPKAPQYNAQQAGTVKARINLVRNVEKIDDFTVVINTTEPTALLPYQLPYVFMTSPARFQEVGSNWDAFGKNPSGTGPYLYSKLVPRERLELVKNPNYWDPNRIPKQDRLVLIPMPEATTRSAALLSGQVDWIEAPLPDTIPRLKQAGMQIVTNAYPHIWSWELSYLPGSPWQDVRVRKAANLAIDRAGMKEMLGGLMIESFGNVERSHPWYGKPDFDIRTDKPAALALMKEAGYGPDKPLKVKVAISTAGSGQMQPLPMNEFVQENLREIGIDVEFEVMDWNALIEVQRKGVTGPEAQKAGIQTINFSRNTQEPFGALCRFAQTDQASPKGANWGHYSNPEIDAACARAVVEFDPVKQAALFAEVHQLMVDDALMVWIAHDVNPRALSPKVHGFIQAKNWFQDLTQVSMEP